MENQEFAKDDKSWQKMTKFTCRRAEVTQRSIKSHGRPHRRSSMDACSHNHKHVGAVRHMSVHDTFFSSLYLCVTH